MKKNVFIIGLGRFGESLAINLHNNDQNVNVMDVDEKKVREITSSYNFAGALIVNATNLDALESTAVKLADHVVVAMSSIEDSILTCVNLRDLGVKNITAKAKNKTHKRVLKSLGIRDIVFPEENAANLVANQILEDDVRILIQGKDNTVIKLTVSNDKLINKPIYSIQSDYFKIFALIRNEQDAETKFFIDNEVIKKLDKLYVICPNNKIKLIKKLFIRD